VVIDILQGQKYISALALQNINNHMRRFLAALRCGAAPADACIYKVWLFAQVLQNSQTKL
jgi:hypothetical protein